MAETPALRAADADRERTVAALGAHAGEGRITVDELDERTSAAYAARTLLELDALVADLPALAPRASAAAPAAGPEEAELLDDFRGHLTTYLVIQVLLIGIWAATGAGYFWPIFPMLGWGVGVALDYAGTQRTARRLRAAAPEQRAAILARHASGSCGHHGSHHRHRHRLHAPPAPPRP